MRALIAAAGLLLLPAVAVADRAVAPPDVLDSASIEVGLGFQYETFTTRVALEDWDILAILDAMRIKVE